MAMNIGSLQTSLKSELKTELISQLSVLYSNIADDHELSGYTFDEYLDRFCTAVANAVANQVISHITSNAQVIGTDSHGDSHDLPVS